MRGDCAFYGSTTEIKLVAASPIQTRPSALRVMPWTSMPSAAVICHSPSTAPDDGSMRKTCPLFVSATQSVPSSSQ